MDKQQLIDLLQGVNGVTFPALGTNGSSSNISIRKNSVRFTRGNSNEYVEIDDLLQAFTLFEQKNEWHSNEFDALFSHSCAKTFFFQLLKYYNLADVIIKGNSYIIIKR